MRGSERESAHKRETVGEKERMRRKRNAKEGDVMTVLVRHQRGEKRAGSSWRESQPSGLDSSDSL